MEARQAERREHRIEIAEDELRQRLHRNPALNERIAELDVLELQGLELVLQPRDLRLAACSGGA